MGGLCVGGFRWLGWALDPVVVGAPVHDALFDLLFGEILSNGALRKCGYFCVGGKAQTDELPYGEGIDQAQLIFSEEVGEAELFFETNDAVLSSQSGGSAVARDHEEDDRHGDPPQMRVLIKRPGVDGCVDCETQIQQQHRQKEEVKDRVVACVVLVGLWLSHNSDDSAGLL